MGRICSSRSKFFHVREDPNSVGLRISSSETTKKSGKLFPFVKMADKFDGVPIELKQIFVLTLFCSERPKLYTILAFLSAIGLRSNV